MKKQIALLAAFCIFLGLCGCASSAASEETVMQPSQTEAITETVTEAFSEDPSTQELMAKVGELMCVVKTRVEDRLIIGGNWDCVLLWENPESYVYACLGENGRSVGGVARFSKGLEPLEVDGIELIEDFDLEQWIEQPIRDFIFQYGEPHFEAGSGFYIPSYISESGTLYYLTCSGEMIFRITAYFPSTEEKTVLWADE